MSDSSDPHTPRQTDENNGKADVERGSHERGPGSFAGRYSLALLTLVVAAGLLYLAWPRLQASVHYLPVDTAIKRYFETGELPVAQLDALRQRAEESIRLYPHYRYHDGLSLVNYLLALSPETEPWLVRPALHRSMTAAQDAVSRAPAAPRTWLRIARTRAALGQSGDEIVGALKMSILTGRVEPTLIVARLELGYAYLELLDAEALSLLRDQTLLGWRVSPRVFRRAITEGRLDLLRIESVIGSHHQNVLQEMEGNT